jgi:hypothetical protein
MSNKETNGSISLNMILFLIFLVLKLTGHIDWSWWWVTSPLWIGALLFIIIVIVIQAIFNK